MALALMVKAIAAEIAVIVCLFKRIPLCVLSIEEQAIHVRRPRPSFNAQSGSLSIATLPTLRTLPHRPPARRHLACKIEAGDGS